MITTVDQTEEIKPNGCEDWNKSFNTNRISLLVIEYVWLICEELRASWSATWNTR